MHAIELPGIPQFISRAADWWTLTTTDLERIASEFVGSMPGGWVRRGDNFIEICGEFGADARKLDAEMAALTTATREVKSAGGAHANLRAATFYHLRFQRIHPLVEANGRVGRMILAGQLHQSGRFSPSDILVGLQDWSNDYTKVFESRDSSVRFELLLDLVARITGSILSSSDPVSSHLNLDPLYTQKSEFKRKGPRLSPETLLRAKDQHGLS